MSPTVMVADEDKKDPAEKTRTDVVPPPRPPKLPASDAPPAAAETPLGEETQLARIPAPPPPLRPPATGAAVPPAEAGATPPKVEGPATMTAASLPPAAPRPAASGPVPPPAPPRPAAAAAAGAPARAPGPPAEEEGRTVFLPASERVSARLQRLKPPGRSEMVTLDRAHYLLGRGHSADLRLYSDTASREHARMLYRDGRWYLEPLRGKVVVVNGTKVREEVPLSHKTRLQLGGDEVLFLDEVGDETLVSARAGAGGTRRTLAIVLIAAGLLLAALWLVASR